MTQVSLMNQIMRTAFELRNYFTSTKRRSKVDKQGRSKWLGMPHGSTDTFCCSRSREQSAFANACCWLQIDACSEVVHTRCFCRSGWRWCRRNTIFGLAARDARFDITFWIYAESPLPDYIHFILKIHQSDIDKATKIHLTCLNEKNSPGRYK